MAGVGEGGIVMGWPDYDDFAEYDDTYWSMDPVTPTDPPYCPFAGTKCTSGCSDNNNRACVNGER